MTPHSRRRHPTSSATELDGPRRSPVSPLRRTRVSTGSFSLVRVRRHQNHRNNASQAEKKKKERRAGVCGRGARLNQVFEGPSSQGYARPTHQWIVGMTTAKSNPRYLPKPHAVPEHAQHSRLPKHRWPERVGQEEIVASRAEPIYRGIVPLHILWTVMDARKIRAVPR